MHLKRICSFLLCGSIFFWFGSCEASGASRPKKSSVESAQVQNNVQETVPVEEPVPQVDPEILKLSEVLALMSDRAKSVIPNGNPEEFLADLHEVLEAEKDFPADDKSLYYLIDKKHNVGADYEPTHLVPLVKNKLYDISRNDLSLRQDVELALQEMAAAALKDNVRLLIISSYRSYKYQTWLFQHWVEVDGLEEAERESARAGTSQHQMGTAVDIGSLSDRFIETPMGKWLYNHAHEYGWSLSFPQGYEDVTGFRWECWHFRYIGKAACRFQKKWFGDVQQVMMEFIDLWKNYDLH